MTDFDNDLQSIQEARTLATQARDAQRKFMRATQAEVDRICAAMAQAAADAAQSKRQATASQNIRLSRIYCRPNYCGKPSKTFQRLA